MVHLMIQKLMKLLPCRAAGLAGNARSHRLAVTFKRQRNMVDAPDLQLPDRVRFLSELAGISNRCRYPQNGSFDDPEIDEVTALPCRRSCWECTLPPSRRDL